MTDAAISLRAIRKRFGAVQAIDHIDLDIQVGECFGLLGPNGAGKTTLISILAGLTRADQGQARIMGYDVVANYRAARRSLGVVPQELVFDPFFTVRETLRFQSGYYGLRRNDAWIDEVMHNLDLTNKADANMRSLSGGMKRRVLVAQALVHQPPVIVLDEPTAGVDVELRQSLWQFMRRLNSAGHTVVLTTHYLEEAEEMCGRIGMLKHGRLVALDSTSALLQRFSGFNLRMRLTPPSLPAAFDDVADAVDAFGRVTFKLREFAEVEGVLARLREAGRHVDEMELSSPDLEEAFVRVMQGN